MMHASAQRASLLMVLVLMVSAVGAAAESTIDDQGIESLTLSVGEIQTIEPLVRNPLGQPDTITLNFTGTATHGMVGWDVTNSTDVTCFTSGNRDYTSPDSCEVEVDAKSSKTIYINLKAQSSINLGSSQQGAFVIDARSQVTKLTGSDSVMITVNPRYSNSRQAPALTPFYIAVIMFAAMTIYWRRS